MSFRHAFWLLGFATVFVGVVCAWEKPFRQYRSLEAYDNVELPADFNERSEWIFARLMYPQHPEARFARRGRWSSDWTQGGTSWTQDYPRADRHFSAALRRLTRVHARSVEQPINPDDDDMFDYPWLFAGEMGDWKLTAPQIKTLREYLLRGGFLMLDDFWGSDEWKRFNETMSQVFPDRPIVEIPDSDAIFHVIYDLDERFLIPGQWGLRRPCLCREDGDTPHWRGIFDSRGRLMVAMLFNSDLGDSWEWADEPMYGEKYSSLGIRLGINYVVYSMTH